MKLISWNVNGLRASLNKGFLDSIATLDADVICLQETKLQPEQVEFTLSGYEMHFNSAEKKGYSGTALITRVKPLSVSFGLDIPEHDNEGRVITAEYDSFYLVNAYVPNSQDGLRRLDYRMTWEDAMREYLLDLDVKKPVVLCGDLNVAHEEIDIKNPSLNRKNAGFTDQERAKFTELMAAGFIDSFRHFHPDLKHAYTWWSYFGNARERNTGWRIDYFVVSKQLIDQVTHTAIHPDIFGSDHCPVEIDLAD